jgi:serine/threonine protein kinase
MSAPLAPGTLLAPSYRVVGHLSRNAALDVYDLFSEERDCRCVGKLVRPDRHDDRAPARLVQEGQILLGLTHPHLVRAYELLYNGDRPVLILETLTGETLSHLIASGGPLVADDAAELGLQLCSAVGYLHRRGWLHLDLKPDNVIAERGIAKVLDLSLARRPGLCPAGLGTRGYRPPEQEAGGAIGPAADVWGIGAVLREATGSSSAVLAPVIGACLQRDPADRPSLDELVAGLSPYAAGAAPAQAQAA